MIFLNVLVFFALSFDGSSAAKHKILIFVELDMYLPISTIMKLIPKYQDVDVHVLTLIFTEVCKNPRPDLILDFTRANPFFMEVVKKISFASYIPTITTSFGSGGDFLDWEQLSSKHEEVFLQIKQPADLVPHIVRAIVEHHKYGNAAVIYDHTFVMIHKLKVLLLNLEIHHTIQSYNTRRNLDEFVNMELFNYFIIGNEITFFDVLTQVCQKKYFGRNFAWYFITLQEDRNMTKCLHARYVVASPKQVKKNLNVDFGSLNTFPTLTKEFYYDILEIGYNVVKDIGKSKLKELCLNGSNEVKSIAPLVKSAITANNKKLINTKYHINSLWTSFAHVEMQLYGYVVNKNGTEKEHIADWTSENITLLTNIGNMEKYASQIIYRISVAVQEPFVYPDQNSPYNYSGYCIDLIEDIAKNVGFKFELYAPEGRGFRYDFNATLYEVKEGRAVIGLGAISVNLNRSSIVDFTIPFYEVVGMLIMMKIPESSKSFFKIIEVLDVGVWATLILFFFITSILLWIFDKFNPCSYQNNRELLNDSDEKREFTLRECFWFCLTSVTSQGGGEPPRPLSGKIISGVWWFFGFLIVASYTANLAAFLTASSLESNIESLEDLSKQYKVKYGVLNGSNAMHYFKYLSAEEKYAINKWTNTHPSYFVETSSTTYFYPADYPIENMYSKMLKFMVDTKSMYNSLEEAIKRVQISTSSENYAYIGDATDIKFAVMTNCDLQIIGEEFGKKFYSLAIRFNSPLKDPLDKALLELLNKRKLEKNMNKWWRENPKVAKCGNRRRQTDGITLQNVFGIFLLIAGGVTIALIITALDDLYERKMAKLRVELHQ